MSTCKKARILKVFSSRKNSDTYWFAARVNHEGKKYTLTGLADLYPIEGLLLEGSFQLVDDPVYGYQYKADEVLTCRLTDKTSFMAYVSRCVCKSLDRVGLNKLWSDHKSKIWTNLIQDPKAVRDKSGLSDMQTSQLVSFAKQRNMITCLLAVFPNMSNRTAKLISENVPGTFDVVRDYIETQPYDLVNIQGIEVAAVDVVYREDLQGDWNDMVRLYHLLYAGVKDFMKHYGATYVNISDFQECYGLDDVTLKKFNRGSLLKLLLSSKTVPVPSGFSVSRLCTLLIEFQNNPGKYGDKLMFVPVSVKKNGNMVREIHLYLKDIWLAKKRVEFVIQDQCAVEFMDKQTSEYERRARALDLYLREQGKSGDINLNTEQRTAVRNVFANKISVISGGPGRGKTYLLSLLIPLWEHFFGENSVMCLGSTGRAVKRMRDMLKRDNMQTLARCMIMNGSSFSRYDHNLPVEGNRSIKYGMTSNISSFYLKKTSLVIIDESSMIDLVMAGNIMQMCRKATMVFIGDVDQLPPIAPGVFLKELIDSDAVPVTYLQKNMRTSVPEIIDRSDLIKEGLFDPNNGHYTNNFFFADTNRNDLETQNAVIAQYKYLMNDEHADFSDILIMSAIRKNQAGVDRLNSILQDDLNPEKHGVYTDRVNTPGLYTSVRGVACTDFNLVVRDETGSQRQRCVRVGDRIINTENNLKQDLLFYPDGDLDKMGVIAGEGVYNGDTGIVERYIDMSGEGMPDEIVIRLDDGLYTHISVTDFSGWELGYVMTVHKAQGSEADHVILALPTLTYNFSPAIHPFYVRNLLYVACTRAKKTVTIIGDKKMFELCAKTAPVFYNNTTLDV